MKMKILLRLKKHNSETSYDVTDDQESSGGSDTIVPEVSEVENDEMIVDNESPRGGKCNFRLTLPPNFTDEYRYEANK